MQAVYGNLAVQDDGVEDGLHRRYALPPGAAEVLTDCHSLNYLGAPPQMLAAVGPHLEKLLEAYRSGGGVSFVVARTKSRAAVLRRSEPTRSSSASDDKVGGFPARSAASGSEQSNRG
jgi:hypothetical protein